MFCVECGAEGPVYQGLCTICFGKKHPVVEPPTNLDVPRCQRCGAFHFRSGWSHVNLDATILQLLRERVKALPPFDHVSFTDMARREDANNYLLTVKAMGRFEDLRRVQDFHVRLRIKPSLCDTCQRQGGRYYEGILQVRADGRDLTAQELRAAQTFVSARVERGRAGGPEFVSRVEQVHGGLDLYVSTNALGTRLGRELAEAFGGTVSASPKLYGQRQGKEIYRVTTLVRLPAFRIGDVVRHKEDLTEVLALRPFVELHNLSTGDKLRFKPKDLRGLRRVDAERFETELRLDARGHLVATHPCSGAERPIRTHGAKPGRHVVVWTADETYISALAGDASKP
jgi:nonsense-mediated mRNA decay protein 3